MIDIFLAMGSSVSIVLDTPTVAPGQLIRGNISMKTKEPVTGIDLYLTCIESYYEQENETHYTSKKVESIAGIEVPVLIGTHSVGDIFVVPFQLEVPHDAEASEKLRWQLVNFAKHVYKLKAWCRTQGKTVSASVPITITSLPIPTYPINLDDISGIGGGCCRGKGKVEGVLKGPNGSFTTGSRACFNLALKIEGFTPKKIKVELANEAVCLRKAFYGTDTYYVQSTSHYKQSLNPSKVDLSMIPIDIDIPTDLPRQAHGKVVTFEFNIKVTVKKGIFNKAVLRFPIDISGH